MYLKYGFHYNNTDSLLALILDEKSNNVDIEYVDYSGPKISHKLYKSPRKLQNKVDDKNDHTLKVENQNNK